MEAGPLAHMQFLIRGGFRHDLVHKLQKLLPPFELGDRRFDFASRHLQRREQIERSMALIGALETADNFTTVTLNITGGPFQCLNARLFIDRYYQCILWWIQIEPDNFSGLCCKLRVGAYTPTSLANQAYAIATQSLMTSPE